MLSARMRRVVLGSIGDLLLDVVVVPSEPIRPGDDVPSTVRIGGGGQAANFCAWVASLGAPARLITRVGDDRAGRILVDELREVGVDVRAVGGSTPTGAIVVIVSPSGERSFATQRGATVQLRPNDIDPSWIADIDLLHVPAYSLFEEPLASATRHAVTDVQSRRGLIAVDLSSTAGLLAYGIDRMTSVLEVIGPDLLFANEGEAATFGRSIDGLARVVVRKLGERGCLVDRVAIPAPRVDVLDTTGAGDAFAAGFCVNYLRSGDPIEAARAAVEAGSRAVARLGGRP